MASLHCVCIGHLCRNPLAALQLATLSCPVCLRLDASRTAGARLRGPIDVDDTLCRDRYGQWREGRGDRNRGDGQPQGAIYGDRKENTVPKYSSGSMV